MRLVLRGLLLVAVVAVSACQATPLPGATTAPSGTADTAAVSPGDGASAGASQPASPAADATATPTPTPKPTPKPIVACTAKQLKAKVTSWVGAMGNQIAAVTVTNASAKACKVRGTPEVQLVDAHGKILIDSKTAGASGRAHVAAGDPTFLLAHNASVKTEVQVADYCGSAKAVLPTTVAFVLPSGLGRIVAAAGPGGGVPDCLSNPGGLGDAGMNGWTK